MKFILFASLLSIILNAQAQSFDFYVFACEWAGSVCESENCSDDEGVSTEFWNIHGLWPSDGNEGLNFCSNEQFNPELLSSLTNELNLYWSGLYSSANSFHSHEWEKHGTCSGMSQETFFSTVLNLAQNLAVYQALENSGITPGGSYECSAIASALQSQYGVSSFSVQSQNGYLSAIQLCVDTNLNVMNCPDGSDSDICSGSVSYPQFNPQY
jgi:ribonuclease T2